MRSSQYNDHDQILEEPFGVRVQLGWNSAREKPRVKVNSEERMPDRMESRARFLKNDSRTLIPARRTNTGTTYNGEIITQIEVCHQSV